MKKFILGLLVCFALCSTQNASAQSSAYTMTGNGDTITNAGTKTNTLKLADGYATVSVQSVVTKISGTVAGTLTLQGSNDGTNYVTCDTTYISLGVATATATNVATQSHVFNLNRNPYLWYRVSYTGSGTMAAKMSSYLVPKK